MNPPQSATAAVPSLREEESTLDLRELLAGLEAVRDGDFSVRIASGHVGLAGKLADTFNDIVASNRRLAMFVGTLFLAPIALLATGFMYKA